MRKTIVAVGFATGLLVSACGNENSMNAPSYMSPLEVSEIVTPTRIQPSETKIVVNVDADSTAAQSLRKSADLTDKLYPRGPEDQKAPIIGPEVLRTSLKVSLMGDQDNLNNDAVCDTYRVTLPRYVEPAVPYIAAVAIGGESNGVFVSWPEDSEGDPGRFAYACSFLDQKPADDDGLVLYTAIPG